MTRPPPTLYYMGRIFEEPWGGVRRAAEAFLREWAEICAETGRRVEVLVPRVGVSPVATAQVVETVLPRFASSRLLWDHWTVPQYVNARGDGVLLNTKMILPLGLRAPGFTSIHDLMYFPLPGRCDWREYLWADTLYMRLMTPRTVRLAPLTHVDSRRTALDAAELFPDVAHERFRVIPNGVDAEHWSEPERPGEEALARGLEARGARAPYVLYSGGVSIRKNVAALAEAFGRFRSGHPEFRLVLTGGSVAASDDSKLAAALAALPADAVVQLGAVAERELILLTQRAHCFVYPSLYEGQGLPPLEAQAAGCPVICSEAGPMPECVGGSALMFNPRSVDELTAALERMTDPAERARWIALGRDNVGRFRWRDSARALLELADEVHAAAAQKERARGLDEG